MKEQEDNGSEDPDFVVEAMSSAGSSSQSARAGSSSHSAGASVQSALPPAPEQARPHNSGSGSRMSVPQGRNTNPMQLYRMTIHFSVNAWVLTVAVLGILPLVPRNLSNKAYRLSLLGTACSSAYSLYMLYGNSGFYFCPLETRYSSSLSVVSASAFISCLFLQKPRAWNVPAVQAWLHSLIMIPVLFWALELVAKFLRHNFSHSSLYRRYLEEPCLWVEANTTTLSILSSNTEIALGFLLIISIIMWRRIILQTFMYWQLLKLMYHAPVTTGYHQSVWAKIGRMVSRYIHHYAPFLNTPTSALQRWWFR